MYVHLYASVHQHQKMDEDHVHELAGVRKDRWNRGSCKGDMQRRFSKQYVGGKHEKAVQWKLEHRPLLANVMKGISLPDYALQATTRNESDDGHVLAKFCNSHNARKKQSIYLI